MIKSSFQQGKDEKQRLQAALDRLDYDQASQIILQMKEESAERGPVKYILFGLQSDTES